MTFIQVEVVSDFTCIWCYIAQRNLHTAIALYRKTYPGGKADTFAITHTAYYLSHNPHGPSVVRRELADKKLADWTPEKRKALTARVEQAGRAAGVEFRWGGKIGSTRDAHRLVAFAAEKGGTVKEKMMEGLFFAFHTRELDLAEPDVLVEVAVGAGLCGGEVRGWLESEETAEQVDDRARKGKEKSGAGVPVFFVSGDPSRGEDRLDGAADPRELMELFVKARESQRGIFQSE